jgi:ribosomal protein S6--L-glutamate ligase
MRLAVLGSHKSWYVRDLLRANAGQHDIVCLSFPELSARIDAASIVECQGHCLSSFDAILVRTMPPGSLEQVVFRMDALLALESAGVRVINPARSLETAIDKYLCTAKLRAAGLNVPPTMVCQSVETAMDAFQRLGSDVVIKPVFGSEGRGIARVTDESIALRAFKTLAQMQATIYLQQFIAHQGYDFRLLVVGRKVLGIRRSNPGDWRTNVSRGATAEKIEVSDRLASLAFRACESAGTLLAGVDVLESTAGKMYVLEVNAVPGWKAVSAACGVDTAKLILDYIELLA